ncbi:pyruvate dehydrogenase E2 component [Spiroplasma sp. TIUS-1]|uniref:2-oxo acid dehydrogenase subunit E2 n=1 Tax=Spiroplasma sp. TIUS-1 TaxID=216963 RepID=UPI0013993104|nr:2-oxo acid dehydrogenase subunit E2 [Spiroplasma sp. TIUS-1]QHX35687.1 pyruvate dehydrogenase E2 component [Spiroplasma sp. TIUS-1]
MADKNSKTNTDISDKILEDNVPKFRELVEQRMNKIMAEENYKVVENKRIDATSSLDSKGRPKTYRNIINQRKEDYEEGTLDIDKVDTTEFNNYSSFVTDSLGKNVTLPESAQEKKLDELRTKPKSSLTYTERKLLNQGSSLNGQNQMQANALDNRRKELDVELAGKRRSNNDSYIEGIEIPVHFNRELKISDNATGEVISTKYKNTVEGRHDFVIWLKLNGIYDRVEKKLPPVTGDQALLKEKLDEEAKIQRVSIRATLNNETGFKIERPQPVKVKKPKQPKKNLIAASGPQLPEPSEITSRRDEISLAKKRFVEKPLSNPNSIKPVSTKQSQKLLINLPSQKSENSKKDNKKNSSEPIIKLPSTKTEISNVVKSAATTIKHRTKTDDLAQLKKEIILLKKELLDNKVNREVYNTVDFEADVNKGFSDADVMFGLEDFESRPVTKKTLEIVRSTVQPNTLSTSIDMSRIIKLKNKLRENDSAFPFSSMAFVVKALSTALEKFPVFNGRFDKTNQQPVNVKKHDIGVIIETDEKTVVPVVSMANGLSIKELGNKLIGITSDIRRGRNLPEEHSSIKIGTFTGSSTFMKPTLEGGNVAIVAMSKIIKKPFEYKGKIYSKASMNFVLTYDQRVSSEEQANEFIKWIKYLLETPEILTLS